MWVANDGIIPPKEFYHDPKLVNIYNRTVAIKLA